MRPRDVTCLLLVATAGCALDDAARRDGVVEAVSRASAVHADVRIEAALPDPVDVPDERGEWVRLRNGGDADAELGGWRLASGGDAGFTFARGTRLRAGASLVLARSTDPRRNGGIANARALTGIALSNRADWLALRDARGRTVDSLAWTAAQRGVVVERAAADSSRPPVTPTPTPTPAPGDSLRAPLEVRVLDVGQGDAVLVRNDSSVVLIDGGPDAAALGRHLDALGLGHDATIDLVVLSHAHADHYAGLLELFRSRRHLTVRFFVENGDPSANAGLRRLRDSVAARVRAGTLRYRDADDPCADGRPLCTFTLRGGARLHVLRPDPSGDGPNDRSTAVKLVSADSGFAIWLAGDAEQRAIAWFEREFGRAPGLDVDVLKANHHGSCNGVTRSYLASTSPALVVASLASVNDYGHMHGQAKAAFESAHVPWYRTDENGTITLRAPGADGTRWSVAVERGAQSMSGRSDRRARCQ
jgi:competence protein ComEC